MRDLGLHGVGLAGAVFALALILSPAPASASGIDTPCCGHFHHGSRVAQAEVVSLEPWKVTVRLLDTPVYCDAGAECASGEFPLEIPCDAADCAVSCPGCESLAVGLRAVFWYEGSSLTLAAVFPVEAGVVSCEVFDAPVELVLANVLNPSCYDDYVEEGYLSHGDGDDTVEMWENCSHAGQGGGVVLALVVGLGLARRKRPHS